MRRWLAWEATSSPPCSAARRPARPEPGRRPLHGRARAVTRHRFSPASCHHQHRCRIPRRGHADPPRGAARRRYRPLRGQGRRRRPRHTARIPARRKPATAATVIASQAVITGPSRSHTKPRSWASSRGCGWCRLRRRRSVRATSRGSLVAAAVRPDPHFHVGEFVRAGPRVRYGGHQHHHDYDAAVLLHRPPPVAHAAVASRDRRRLPVDRRPASWPRTRPRSPTAHTPEPSGQNRPHVVARVRANAVSRARYPTQRGSGGARSPASSATSESADGTSRDARFGRFQQLGRPRA